MIKLVVYVRGGVVQNIVADIEGVEVMIVDYDDEKCSQTPDRSFHRAYANSQLIAQTVSGIEDASLT